MLKSAANCRQIVVLSHDVTFMKQLWDKAHPSDRACLALLTTDRMVKTLGHRS
jgi:hypothetical protein